MKKFLVLFAALCLLLCMTACGNSTTGNTEPAETSAVVETTTAAATESTPAFEVTVVDSEGNPVSGVMLQVCKDTCFPAVTDANGVASFNIEVTAEHKLSVLSCPEGYVYSGEAEVYLEDGATEYTVELDAQ